MDETRSMLTHHTQLFPRPAIASDHARPEMRLTWAAELFGASLPFISSANAFKCFPWALVDVSAACVRCKSASWTVPLGSAPQAASCSCNPPLLLRLSLPLTLNRPSSRRPLHPPHAFFSYQPLSPTPHFGPQVIWQEDTALRV